MSKGGIPKSWTDMIGTDVKMQGGIFSGKVSIEPTVFSVLDVRWGGSTIVNMKTKEEWPSVQLLVKNETMKRSRWTKSFACKEIKLGKRK